MHGGIDLIDKRQCFAATVESVADRMATLKLVFFLAACRTIQGMSVLPPAPKANASPFLPQCEVTLVPHVTKLLQQNFIANCRRGSVLPVFLD
jgi:hypothetical protein